MGYVIAFYPVIIGILGAITVLIVLARLGIRKFMGYPALLDAGIVLVLALLFHGTYAGTIAAVIGGLFFSALITVIRKVYGYQVITFKGIRTYPGLIQRLWQRIRD